MKFKRLIMACSGFGYETTLRNDAKVPLNEMDRMLPNTAMIMKKIFGLA